jgi:hypothetical protein
MIGAGMKKNFLCVVLSSIFLSLNLCGCAAVLVGAAAGAGTGVWFSGKLSQQIDAPAEKVADAARSVLIAMKAPITAELKNKEVIELRSVYMDGRKIWINIFFTPQDTSRIEVRVGALGDKTASEILIKRVTDKLALSGSKPGAKSETSSLAS